VDPFNGPERQMMPNAWDKHRYRCRNRGDLLASAAASALIIEGKGSAQRTGLETAPA
jgi:hypothetical protein